MSATQTDFIKFLVNDCIQGIENDIIDIFYDEKNWGREGFNVRRYVNIKDFTLEKKREWLTNDACGKNNKDRLKFVKLCNSIKDRKLKELMSHCIKLDKQNTKYLEEHKKFWEDPTKEVEGETILLK